VNITEANNITLLIRALSGDSNVDCVDVTTAALELKARIQAALLASPPVVEGLVMANVVTLQAMTRAGEVPPVTKAHSDEQVKARRTAREHVTNTAIKPAKKSAPAQSGEDKGYAVPQPEAKAEAPKAEVRPLTGDAKVEYDKRVAAQHKTPEPSKA
jgi:hypothetical protein